MDGLGGPRQPAEEIGLDWTGRAGWGRIRAKLGPSWLGPITAKSHGGDDQDPVLFVVLWTIVMDVCDALRVRGVRKQLSKLKSSPVCPTASAAVPPSLLPLFLTLSYFPLEHLHPFLYDSSVDSFLSNIIATTRLYITVFTE